jgi:predicted CXXCH cytochrome family protein
MINTRVQRAIRAIVPLLIALAPTLAWTAPGDGIRGTAHDFSGLGNPATGLCSFCHTPHEAQSTLLSWNHTLSSNTFSWKLAATGAGTPYPTIQGDIYQGATAKCLSCHDGSVAVGDLVRWNGGPVNSLLNVFISGKARIGKGGNMRGSHPVAMPYPWNNGPSTYNGVTTGPGIVLSAWVADPTTVGIRLYNDDGSGNIRIGPVAGQTGIECSSCHDPHNGPGVEDNFFLRGTAAGICTKCHNM